MRSATDHAVDNGSRPTSAPALRALGVGCAELFRLPSARARRRLLDAALDAGITHFDVAPMYGLGAAERELGAFARGRRDRVFIATKFGIDPTRAARALGAVQGPIRRVLEARPGMRAQARASAAGPASGLAGGLLYRSPGYGAAAARASLERSLRALRCDHIDLFLLHDPSAEGVAAQGVGEELERATAQGLIRAWGVAGEPGPAIAVAARLSVAPTVLQIRDDVFTRSLERVPVDRTQRITFGTLGPAVGRIAAHLRHDPAALARWRGLVEQDVDDREVVAALLLRHARRRNPSGTTLLGTTRVERLGQAVTAVSSSALDDSVTALVGLVEAELAEPISRDVLR